MDKLIREQVISVIKLVFKDRNVHVKEEHEHGPTIYTNITLDGKSRRSISLCRWKYDESNNDFIILMFGTKTAGFYKTVIIDKFTGLQEIVNICEENKERL